MAQLPLTITYQSNLQPSPNGLLAGSVGPLPIPEHASFAGVQFNSDLCGEGYLYPGACDTTPPAKTFVPCDDPGGCDLVTGLPFWTYVTEQCAPVGRSLAEAERKVRRKAQLRESYLVERAFWGDDAGVPGYLQQLGATPIGAPTNVVEALAALEQDAADNFGLPITIHARPGMVTRLGAAGAIRSTTGPLLTWNGNRIVSGAGFQAVDEAGDPLDADTDQMWATGPVTIWRGDPIVSDPRSSLNRSSNQMFMLAEQPWIIAHECYAAVITVGPEA